MAIIYMTNQCCPCEGLTSPCCEQEEVGCCMYSAKAYTNGLLTFADLPDAFKTNDDRWVKREFPEQINETTEIIYDLVGGEDFEESMVLSTEIEDQPVWNFLIGGVSHDCLIDEFWQDEFADNYSITKEFTTDERSRVSLCVWGGSQGGYLAYYDGNDDFIEFYYSGPPHKWIYIAGTLEPEEGGGVWEKDDPQNGPEGTYSPSANAGDFAGIGTAVVAPA